MFFRKIKNHVHATLSDAQHTMSAGQQQVLRIVDKACDMMEEVEDGMRLRLVYDKEGTLLQFLNREIEECPVAFRVEFKEPEDDQN